MQLVVAVVAAVAIVGTGCSSPSGPSGHGDDDDAPCDTDRDGDGVCDAKDVCPDVADPAQVDLDGDGVGFLCDPLESIAVPPPQPFDEVSFDAMVSHGTFAAITQTHCFGARTCDHAIVVVTADGSFVRSAESTDPDDAWLHQNALYGPEVTQDGVAYFPQFQGNGLARVDPVTGVEHLFDELGAYGLSVAGSYQLFVVGDGTSSQLLAPHGNELSTIATMDGGLSAIQLTPGSTFALSSSTQTTSSLATFTLGDTSITPVSAAGVPITNAPGLVALSYVPIFGELPLCIDLGTSSAYVSVRSDGTSSTSLPAAFDHCSLSPERVGSTWLLHSAGPTATTWSIAIAKHGVVTTPALLTNLSQQPSLGVGDNVPILTFPAQGTANAKYVAITPDGDAILLHASLHDVAISTRDEVVHLVGLDDTNKLVLVRYRPTTGVQEVTLSNTDDGVAFGRRPILTTTEGGVVVSIDGRWSAIPSTSMTRTDLVLRAAFVSETSGGVIDGVTLVPGIGPTDQAVLTAYREVAGVPTLTQLGDGTIARVTGSSWFSHNSDSVCSLARLTGTADAPVLDTSHHCRTGSSGFGGLLLANGDVVWVDDATADPSAPGPRGPVDVYITSGDAITKVASSIQDFRLVANDLTREIYGWTGNDAMGRFVCLATHPDRCWTIPEEVSPGWDELFDHPFFNGDDMLVMSFYSHIDERLTIFHSVGTGDRPPPL